MTKVTPSVLLLLSLLNQTGFPSSVERIEIPKALAKTETSSSFDASSPEIVHIQNAQAVAFDS